jgi:hypothetical protein
MSCSEADFDCGFVPFVEKGWQYRQVASLWAEGYTWGKVVGVSRLPVGKKAVSSVPKVSVPQRWKGKRLESQKVRSVKVGNPVDLVVRVYSRGDLTGGKVVVKKGGKILGKATIKHDTESETNPDNQTVVTVRIQGGKLKVGKHQVSIQYLGNKTARKSQPVKFTVTIAKT